MGDSQVAELPEGTHIATDGDGRYLWRGTIDLRDNPAMANLVTKIAVGIVGGFTVLFALLILLASPEPSQVPMMLGE